MFECVEVLARELKAQFETVDVDGCPGFVLFDHSSDVSGPRNWLWYAPTFADRYPHLLHAWMFGQFLAAGMTMVGIDVGESYGNPQGRNVFSTFYDLLRKEYKLAKQVCFLPQSRGGLMIYNWAVEHPERVACIAGIYPVGDISSFPGIQMAASPYNMSEAALAEHLAEHNPVDRLEPLARAKVPIFHVHGDADTAVPLEGNSGEMQRRYQQLGGPMELLIIPGKGHDWSDEYFQCQRLVDFVLENVR